MNQIAILLLCAALTASHLTAYHMGRNADATAKLDQALAYAAEIAYWLGSSRGSAEKQRALEAR